MDTTIVVDRPGVGVVRNAEILSLHPARLAPGRPKPSLGQVFPARGSEGGPLLTVIPGFDFRQAAVAGADLVAK